MPAQSCEGVCGLVHGCVPNTEDGDKHSIGVSGRTYDPLSYMRKLWLRLGATRRGHQLENTELEPEPRSVLQKSLPPNLGQGHKSSDA